MAPKEAAQAQSKVEELRTQLEAAIKEEAQQAHKAAQQELSKAQTSFTEAIAKAAVEAGELRRKVNDLQQDLEKAKGEAKASEHRAEAAMSKLVALQAERGASSRGPAQGQSPAGQGEKELQALRTRLAAAEKRNQELVEELKTLKAKAVKETTDTEPKAKIEPVSHPTPVKSSGPSWADVLEQEVQQAEEAAATAAKEAEKRREEARLARQKERKKETTPTTQAEAAAQEARVAARQRQIEEQRKKEEQKIAELKRLRKQREEEERREKEEEEAAREQQRREDEEREARKMLDLAIQKQDEEEKAIRKLARQEERKRREEEEQKRLEKQKDELSVEDFEALLLMKAEVEPEEECSPDELDEDEILDFEIKRVQREEMKNELQKKMAARSSPGVVDPFMGAAFPEELQKKISKSRQEKQRSMLKQKLQAKREMASLVQSQGRRH